MASTQTMKTVPMSPRAAPRATVPVKPERRGGASPRVRRRLSDAQESATIFSMVCEQGEVIQWMTACHPDLTAFGVALERRGYRTLSSIVFLTEEDVECVTNSDLRQLLLTTLSRLRHELFRM
ncbi:uncharacterized protein PITG_11629 [Phytophthora infestans T30-4]|uniref:SAM domain-containing protein n=1 Tax=Phytophthora infestans (strain T30-4) TaxID=403677 RepID=D0NI72_PHYIT|nr:uncharacterized protein PITG_11629 [Phytophthora infestans T30-4]EEY59157.1 conserved hypothetical protein [Phytophthora infestans T30-4]|eukprot:XP_002901171.1 conserved hypothetical protein [Phytophthora infestans T30-4]